MSVALRPWLLLALLAFLGVQLAGCAGAPVQEMSDARQAVHAAEQADAAQYAPQLFEEAQALLKQAQLDINSGEYRECREHALQARAKAIEARQKALAAQGKKP
jgi:predicted S18 family serine protease